MIGLYPKISFLSAVFCLFLNNCIVAPLELENMNTGCVICAAHFWLYCTEFRRVDGLYTDKLGVQLLNTCKCWAVGHLVYQCILARGHNDPWRATIGTSPNRLNPPVIKWIMCTRRVHRVCASCAHRVRTAAFLCSAQRTCAQVWRHRGPPRLCAPCTCSYRPPHVHAMCTNEWRKRGGRVASRKRSIAGGTKKDHQKKKKRRGRLPC